MLADIAIPALLSRWVHLFSIIAAVGGTIFIRLVLRPAMLEAVPDDNRPSLEKVVLSRWSRILHVLILLIIVTGVYNAIVTFPQHKGQPLYHGVFGVKVLLALGLFFIAIAVTGKSAAFEGMRKKRPTWLAFNVLLAAIIVLLSNVLKNIPLTP